MDETWIHLSDDEHQALRINHPLEGLQAERDRDGLAPRLAALRGGLKSSHLQVVFDSVLNAADIQAYPAILIPLNDLLETLALEERWLLHYRLALTSYRESMLEVAGGFAEAAHQLSMALANSGWKAVPAKDRKQIRHTTHRMERLSALSIAWGAMAQGLRPMKSSSDTSLTMQANALAVEFQARQWGVIRADAEQQGFQKGFREGTAASSPVAKDDEADLFDQQSGVEPAVAVDLVSVVLSSASTFRDMDKGVRAIIGKPLPFVVAGKLIDAREKLVARHPHAAAIIESLMSEAREGRPVRLRPTLLLGAPGVGKSLLARELLGALGIPFAMVDAGTCSDHAITGSARRWSESYPSLPLRLWSEHNVANPAIIVDELEKAGRSSAGSLHDPLLGLLERGSSERWRDHHIDSEVNASGLNWLMTANSLAGIPAALLSRLRVLKVPLPKREHIPSLAASLRLQILQERNLDPAIEPPLASDEIEAIADAFGAEGSIRDLKRYVAGILDGRAAIAARN